MDEEFNYARHVPLLLLLLLFRAAEAWLKFSKEFQEPTRRIQQRLLRSIPSFDQILTDVPIDHAQFFKNLTPPF